LEGLPWSPTWTPLIVINLWPGSSTDQAPGPVTLLAGRQAGLPAQTHDQLMIGLCFDSKSDLRHQCVRMAVVALEGEELCALIDAILYGANWALSLRSKVLLFHSFLIAQLRAREIGYRANFESLVGFQQTRTAGA